MKIIVLNIPSLIVSHCEEGMISQEAIKVQLQTRNVGCTVKPLSIVPGSVVQFLWSLSEFYLKYGSHIYCFPRYIVSFSDPR
jgi:hypothetical protein